MTYYYTPGYDSDDSDGFMQESPSDGDSDLDPTDSDMPSEESGSGSEEGSCSSEEESEAGSDEEAEGDSEDEDDSDGNSITSLPATLTSTASRRFFYRVYDDDSISQYTVDGFVAGDECMPSSLSEFGDMVESHANWHSRVLTPFISMTDNLGVVRWQMKLRNRPGIMVAMINASILIDVYDAEVWEMHVAMDHFGIDPPGRCQHRTFDHEYICALNIPDGAVVGCYDPEVFEEFLDLYSSD